MRKRTLALLTLALLVSTFVVTTPAVSAKKTKTKTFIVMEGGTRVLPCDTSSAKIKVKSKKKVSVQKNQQTTLSKFTPTAGKYSYEPLVKGKKSGKTTITVTTPSTKYIYNVTVLSKKSVQKAAKKALAKYAKKLKDTKQCAYMDFNGDGVKELYHDGQFTYYNYAVKKVVTKPYYANEDANFKELSSLTVDPKNGAMFAIPKKEETFGNPSDPDASDYSGIYYGRFAFMNREMVFDITNIDVLKYAKPQTFLGEAYVAGTDYYCYHIDNFDQDDYWYEAFTLECFSTTLNTNMPNSKEVVFTQNPVIK